MKPCSIVSFGILGLCFCQTPIPVQGQGAPDILWQAQTPSGIANSIEGIGWSPNTSGPVTFGSTDRWMRTRQADNGLLLYSVLQPIRSGSVDQTIYSTDGTFIAVHNSGGGPSYRVHRAVDGAFLGLLTVAVETNGLVRFAADNQLSSTIGGDGTLSRWQIGDFRVVFTVGSGYQLTNTTFNFSPDGALQSAAKQGTITIRRRSDGSILRAFSGGSPQGVTPVAFTPDSARIAAWSANPNRVTLWRVSDGAILMSFPSSATNEGIGAIRFTPDGAHMVTTGYLPFLDADGLWQQNGMIRFWRVSDGALRRFYDASVGIAVTSPVAWSPDAACFAFGTYEGTAFVARTPTEIQTITAAVSLKPLTNGNVLLRQSGTPGTAYHMEATTNFLTWREICVLTVNTNGYCEFLDTNCNGFARKFYRSWKAR